MARRALLGTTLLAAGRRRSLCRVVVVLLGLCGAVSCGGAKPGSDGTQATAPPAREAAKPSGCSGSLSGAVTGTFSCMVTVNYYYDGSEMVGGRRNALVSILSNPFDPRHTRPAGVKNVGGNVEIAGEPKPGTFAKADAGAATLFSVILDDNRMFDRIQDLKLTLDSAAPGETTEALGIKSRLYGVGGRLEATLADEAGAEVRLSASF
jgi:hypothetical protein